MRPTLALLSLALLSAVALPVAAKADTIKTFNFNGTLQLGTVNGTVTIDTTTGKVTNENFAATLGKTSFVFNSAPTLQFQDPSSPYDYITEISGSAFSTFQLAFDTKSLVNYTGGNIFTAVAGKCNLAASSLDGIDLMTSGKLTAITPVSPTPEPASLLLLGTGMLGVAGAMRRRVRAAASSRCA